MVADRKDFGLTYRDKDSSNKDAVSVRLHGKGNVGAKPKDAVIADLLASIQERRP